MCYQVCENSPC
uniref:Uncharacterized protein n=1 Tax=Rhizophora mucronata TaxID=61149 RepID=A0A2P2PRW4_RHIMU